MKFKNVSNEAVVELLKYMAENQDFDSVRKTRRFNNEDVSNILNELAQYVSNSNESDVLIERKNLKSADITSNIKKVVSGLNPDEEKQLFSSFKIG